MQAAIDNFKIHDRPCIKLIHKNDMFNEDGSPWETLDSKKNSTNKNSNTTAKTTPKAKKESTSKNNSDNEVD